MPVIGPTKRTGTQELVSGFQQSFLQAMQARRQREEKEAAAKEQKRQFEVALKERTIENAYKVAQDAAAQYADQNPEDEELFVNAQVKAAETFDNYMTSVGFPDTTYLKITGEEVPEPVAEVETPPMPAAPLPQQAQQLPTQAVRGAKEVAGRYTPEAVGGVETLKQLPQIPAALPLAAEQAAPPPFRPFTFGVEAPQQVLQATQQALPNIPQSLMNIIQQMQQRAGSTGRSDLLKKVKERHGIR